MTEPRETLLEARVVIADDQTRITADGKARVIADDQARMAADDQTRMAADGKTRVVADGKTRVVADDQTRVARVPFKPLKLEGLTKDWRFRRIRNKGKPGRASILSLKWISGKQGLFVGIVASKKVGNAVFRNRIRRRIREALRRMDLPPLEAVIIANPEAAKARYPEIIKALYTAMRKAGLK